jgi:hypothetical protein
MSMSTPDASPPERGPLSVDEAVDLITGEAPGEEEEEVGEAEPAGDEADDQADDDPAPPYFWSTEDKAAFSELPLHLQEKIVAYEKNRDDATARVIQEAAEARNAAAAEAAEIGALGARLGEVLPQVEAAFLQAWGRGVPDWARIAAQHGPEAASQLRARFEQDAATVMHMQAAKQEADARSYDGFVRGELEKLKREEPELADPARGGERRQAVARFLVDQGFPPEQIRYAGAKEYAIAYDALRYRQARAGLAQSEARGPGAKPGVQPGAAQVQRSSARRRAESARSRFAEKPTVDNAVAAILARG